MNDRSEVADLEIVEGAVWDAVGGELEDAVSGDDEVGGVQVKRVDPRRYRIELAGGSAAVWAATEEGDSKTIEFAPFRYFKIKDIVLSVFGEDDLDAFTVDNITVTGTSQFSSQDTAPVPAELFGALAISRPRMALDTVQTTSPLIMTITHRGPAIAATMTMRAGFSGVALRR